AAGLEKSIQEKRQELIPCLRVLVLELDVERFFELLEFALEGFQLRSHVEARFDIVKTFFCPRKTGAGNPRQFLDALADFAVDILLGGQRRQFFSKDLFEAFLGELSHKVESQ